MPEDDVTTLDTILHIYILTYLSLMLCRTGLFQLLTLLILSSNVCTFGCKLGGGGVVSIIAALVWFLIAAICMMVPEARDPINNNGNQMATATASPVQLEIPVAAAHLTETTTTTQRVEEDGTTVIEDVVFRSDGTTTCTTSIIPPATAAVAKEVSPTDMNFGYGK